ncbi:hypothetical protein SAMN05518856_11419 [Paenibacillus sp. OK003]|nr:hypothetical protein SAMN05518856_11419 [Paenibacillus sp. OK003]
MAALAPIAPQGGAKGSGYARGQLLRLAALAPVASQGGAKGSGYARGQLLRLAALAPVASQGGAKGRAALGGSCFAWLPVPLLLRKAGLRAGLRVTFVSQDNS